MPDFSSKLSNVGHNPQSPLEVRFYLPGTAFCCFTNFSDHPVSIGNRRWRTTEHFFQAQKFITTDPASVEDIFAAATPRDAAQIGRDRARPIRTDWEQIKDNVMRVGVFTKLISYPQIAELLLGTGNARIIEESPRDSYWGCGADGNGRNMLGKILMEARAFLMAGSAEQLQDQIDSLLQTIPAR